MASRALLMGCLRTEACSPRDLSMRPRYPPIPRYPKCPVAESAVDGRTVEDAEEPRTALLAVEGMSCAACAGSVEKAIKRLPGIHDAAVDVLNGRAQVLFYPSFVDETMIRNTIEDAGFEATLIDAELNRETTVTCRMHIKGMTCTSCSTTVESALQRVYGVQKAVVALATEEAEIHYNPKLVSANQLIEKVVDIGFEAIVVSTGDERNKVHLKLEGIHTDQSIRLVENSLQALPGVEEINIDAMLHKISVSYKSNQTGPRDFIEVIESIGSGRFKASIFPEESVPLRLQEIMYLNFSIDLRYYRC